MKNCRFNKYGVLLVLLLLAGNTNAATLTCTTNAIGETPTILAYNSGHFFDGSNTKDWWRYAGVNGARVFLSPSAIEPSDDIDPVGDGVNSSASFLDRKAALRADPLNTNYINWAGSSVFSNRYETKDLYPANHIRANYTFSEMRKLGIKICVQITASESRLPIVDANDWAGKWELWQHYYAQAFYLGRTFDVESYQMFNEPNHANANGLTIANHLIRLQLVSDAVQSALADVNAIYGKSLSPRIHAPVTAGSADGSYTGWGESVVNNRHKNFLGQTDTNFSLIQVYDYHEYGSTPVDFGNNLSGLNNLLTANMSPEPRFPTAISEFNTDTGADFDTQTETLDSPAKYARFGSICVNLISKDCRELYCFKFSQTERSEPTTYPVAKNAMHYVDNANAPYNVGGITKAGEVYRLFNKAFAAGRSRLSTTKGTGAANLSVHSSYDPVRRRYYLFSVNDTASPVSLDFALSSLPVSIGNRVLVEEVSEARYGSGKLWTTVPTNKTVSAGLQASNSVWLLTVPVASQSPEQIIAASDDAEVRDGANNNNNYGAATSMTARNDPANADARSAAVMKFNLPALSLTNLEFAVLSFQAGTVASAATVQAHVYGLTATNWSQDSITWATAPNLRQNVAAGNMITNLCVTGAGDTAFIVGQAVVSSTNMSETLIDVTDWLRTVNNSAVSFMVSQDPRWDVELPSLAPGDTQPDGVKILTSEGGAVPRLRLVFKAPPSTSPVASNDLFNAMEDVPLVVNAPGVLVNDFDAETNTLAAVLVVAASNGVVSLNSNGSFTYTPNADFNGNDAFYYKVNDGETDSSNALVSITVASVNDLPVARDDFAETQSAPVVINVLSNDSDIDGGALSIVSFAQGVHGVVSNNGNGTLTYSPSVNFAGTDRFNYTITDGQGGTNSARANITVIPAGVTPYWTNLLVSAEAVVRGGASAAVDQDEATAGYILVKYYDSPFDSSRKAYFQFDLTGFNVNGNTQAILTLGFQGAYTQNVKLWALNQPYPGFTPAVTWNTAQANDLNSNDLLIGGQYSATPVSSVTNLPVSGTLPVSLSVRNIGNYIHSNRVTLALCGAPDGGGYTNNVAGLRMLRANATLQVLVIPVLPPATTNYSVPHAWLANWSWTNGYESAALADQDGDGYSTWQEYWSGTDPLDSSSFLKIDSIGFSGTNLLVTWRHSQVDAGIPPITIQARTNLVTGAWVGIGSHPPTNGVNIWSAGSPVQGFYRLAVTNAP
jgi:VCBS repeat-containing protein